MRTMRIYCYGVGQNRLRAAAQNLGVMIDITNDLYKAEIVITLKNYYRKRPQPIIEAEDPVAGRLGFGGDNAELSTQQGIQQGRFPGIGFADQPHVGDQLELEAQMPGLSGRALGRLARSPIRAALEARVAQTAAPAGSTQSRPRRYWKGSIHHCHSTTLRIWARKVPGSASTPICGRRFFTRSRSLRLTETSLARRGMWRP